MLRDDIADRVADLLRRHPGEAMLIEIKHEKDLCACGGGDLDPLLCTCWPEILLHPIPDRVADVVEPVLLRRIRRVGT